MTTGLALTLMATAARDAAIREAAWRHLDTLAEESSVAMLRPAIEDRVALERGTPLEPFVVRDTDVRMAGALATIVLGSPADAGQTTGRVRVVSRDKLVPTGGLSLGLEGGGAAPRLHARYVERYLHDRELPESVPETRFAPGLMPGLDELSVARPAGRLWLDDAGIEIRIEPFPTTHSIYQVRDRSRLAGLDDHDRGSLHAAGLQLDTGGPDTVYLRVRPRTPEGAMRLTGWCFAGRWLAIDLGQDGREQSAVGPPPCQATLIQLVPPQADASVNLSIVPILDELAEQPGGWLRTRVSLPRPPDPALVAKLGRTAGIAPDWEGALMEASTR